MQENTRMKKYEQLRQSIYEKSNDVVETPKLSRFAKRLNNIDPAYFEPIVKQLGDRPLDLPETAPARAKNPQENKTSLLSEDDPFLNEDAILARALRLSSQEKEESNDDDLLNQFLKEIRSYNMKQGVRSQEDTRLEILKQIRIDAESKKPSSVKTVSRPQLDDDPSSDTIQRLNIARQVKELMKEGQGKEDLDEDWMQKQRSYQQAMDEDRLQRQKLLEETQQLRLQLSEHEEELDEIGTGIDYTRKLLNLLVALLMITVVIAGAILGYLILNQ